MFRLKKAQCVLQSAEDHGCTDIQSQLSNQIQKANTGQL